jgi:hypothetical protein
MDYTSIGKGDFIKEVMRSREARRGQVKQVFHAAIDEPSRKRHACLQEVCAGDQGLLAENA